jgi:hypothetical protein
MGVWGDLEANGSSPDNGQMSLIDKSDAHVPCKDIPAITLT